MRQLSWFHVAGTLLALWGVLNTVVSVVHYGWGQGVYFWFCNLALLATAWGLWARDRNLLLGFLGMSVLVQPPYIADSLARLLGAGGLFDVAEFMYHPGMPLGEFTLSRYHYFLIPVTALAVLQLPRRKDRTLYYVGIGNLVIFAASYALFPPAENINCIHKPCFWESALRREWYPPVFFVTMLVGNLLAVTGLEWLFQKIASRKKDVKRLNQVLVGLLVAGAVLGTIDTLYKRKLPRFECDSPLEDSGVRIACLYTQEHSPDLMELTYQIENKLDEAQQCDARLNIFGTEYEDLHQHLYLRPKEKMRMRAVLPYIGEDVKAKIAASCTRFK